jgi:large subunit ribosomal protein L25
MSSDKITVALEKREVLGKGLAKIRQEGHVPAVIHDHGKDSIHVMGEFITLNKVYAAAGKHHPVELKVDGKQHLALIKDVDFEPTKHRMRHIVFQAIKQNEEVEAEIPVVFAVADIPAERVSLLVLKQLDHVEVKALPKNLPDELVVDPSTLAEVGDHLTVADIKVPEGVTILTPLESSLAVVEMPKDQIAEANAIAAEQAETAGTTEQPGETTEGEEAAQPSESTEE